MLWRAKPHVAGGSGKPGKQGTGAGEGLAANVAIMAFWAAVGRKTLVFVNRGTAFCASCRKPSKATNRNVLSFLIGRPMAPPNCWRLKVSLMGEPSESALAGLKVWPGCNAWLNENGFWASIASLRKKP